MQLAKLKRRAAFQFIAPAVILLAALNLFPFFYALWMSLHRMGLAAQAQPRWVGFGNYQQAFNDERIWAATLASATFVTGAVIVEIILGTIMAFVFNQKLRGLDYLRRVSILPVMVMPIVTALVWFYLFNPNFGLVNWLTSFIGLEKRDWLTTEGLAMAGIIMADVWQWTPFVMLVVFAGLQSLPEYIFEAAKMDGLNRWQTLWRVTLPMLQPTILVVLLIRLVDSFKTMELVFIMTHGAGSTEILPYYVYLNAFVFRNLIGYAAVISLFMIVLITIAAQLIAKRIRMEC
jgi:multiple sugar transport system permease protein